MHRIEIIYFTGCPNFRKSCDVVCQVLESENVEFELIMRPVKTETDIMTKSFLGSPTVLVNGLDVEICFTDPSSFLELDRVPEGLACRLYDCEISNECPSEEMIRCALQFQ